MMEYNDNGITIYRFTSQSTGKNEYLIISEREAACVDIIDSLDNMKKALEKNNARLKYLLVTHAHRTRVNVIAGLKKKFGGEFCLHEYDHELLAESELSQDRYLKDNEILKLGDIRINVLHTPGHTKGSLSFWIKKAGVILTGNTFIKGGHGKIWGPKSMSLMIYSLKRLNYNIPVETLIYPGSGELTSMGGEAWVNCLRSA